MALIWRKHLSVGNAMLDFEHKSLIGMVNSIEYAINTKNRSTLFVAIKLFKDRADTHFANEVRFAQALNLSFTQHELAHQHLQKELLHTVGQLAVKVNTWPEYVMDYYPQFLRDWLIEHITDEDMLMKPALQTRDYTFWPGGKDDETNHIAGHTANLYLQL